jgi:glycosyltransferase involved in cell wall biosynthesis
MTIPPISVVVSVFKNEPFLREAVEGIPDGSFGDLEFIVIHDGSTEGSGLLASRWCRRSPVMPRE